MRKFSVKAVKIVLDAPLINAPGLIDAPFENFSKILSIH